MYSRRTFLNQVKSSAIGLPLLYSGVKAYPPLSEGIRPPSASPSQVARDEAYWSRVQQAFSVDRSIIHLNNGGVTPIPTSVRQAQETHERYAARVPFYVHRRTLKPQLERVRVGIARAFGCSPEEIAITRNTSEGMAICQMGLTFLPGDEVLTTDQDYPRMLHNWQQRELREGIVLKQVPLPVPAENEAEIVKRFKDALTKRTRAIMICHMIDLTGQVMPVQALHRLASERDIPLLVDGAQAFGQRAFTLKEVPCTYYAASLHKWFMAPPGTGFLYVKKDHIASTYPLLPTDPTSADDIRKFEDIGTQSLARFIAIAEALVFQETIQLTNKEARLLYLKQYVLNALRGLENMIIHSSTSPRFGSCLTTIEVNGIDSTALRDYLWNTHRIIVRPIKHPSVQGIRISPSLQTTLQELDHFIDVMNTVNNAGIPS